SGPFGEDDDGATVRPDRLARPPQTLHGAGAVRPVDRDVPGCLPCRAEERDALELLLGDEGVGRREDAGQCVDVVDGDVVGDDDAGFAPIEPIHAVRYHADRARPQDRPAPLLGGPEVQPAAYPQYGTDDGDEAEEEGGEG